MPTPPAYRQTSRPMKIIFYLASGLVLLAGLQLFAFSEQTDVYFAWTITPFITAAFLGAGYWTSVLLEFLAARENIWVRSRAAALPVLTFTTLTLIATLLHLDKFHLDVSKLPADGPVPPWMTVAAAWAWIAVYGSVPPLMTAILIYQLRQPGTDEPRQAPMPMWLSTAVGVQGGVMMLLGVLLFFAKEIFPANFPVPTTPANPIQLLPFWPWLLTPLTARAVGAWLLGLGLTGVTVALERDFARVRIIFFSAILFCGLQFVVLARYPTNVTWDARAWGYVIFVLSLLGTSVYGLWAAQQAKR